mmetsp:Transcript_13252/g.41929  ORF Transcript_13252/g.41929 Transcript_13252/m.41929 type:complete len:490 (-) Transcript_13252:246-1715(-)|eukprot:CAMPEP_0182858460 /NCGR_PEP_ID=MMETSP0034_2-20130328/3692_1 /TAXON_ID=156128 /ORGANISM="Nephroselmis pyriformis, Strain CCMP717" /LENGTH=489 /DNA_ID=CAMNT_0024989893 /DNA_START=392 /DNA_END=1861 /DNA_ORIENTATION=-
MTAMEEDKPVVPVATEKKKGEVDYTQLDNEIEVNMSLAKKGNLKDALESLLNLEKKQRVAAEIGGTKRCVVAIVKACFEKKAYTELNEHIVLISKRRSQLKQAVVAMVQEAMTYVPKIDDIEKRVELIATLNTVTAGKIYVEVERARLTKLLASIKESQGKIDEAADIMQEVAVETHGALAKTEKIAFILEQVRLCLDKKDFIRAQIMAKKIAPRTFEEKKKVADDDVKGQAEKKAVAGIEGMIIQDPAEGTPSLGELKIKYFELMIRYHSHHNDYLEICRCYQSIFECPETEADPEKWRPVLQKICWFLCLAPYGPMQSSLMHATASAKKLADLPVYQELLKQFTTFEIIRWPTLAAAYAAEIQAEAEVFGGPDGEKRGEDLRLRVVEHNILVVSKYYGRCTMPRLAELLDLTADLAEKHLSDMVVAKALFAKIDRPAGVVVFRGKQDASEHLNAWAGNIAKLLDLVEKSCHGIHKESMLHKVPIGAV